MSITSYADPMARSRPGDEAAAELVEALSSAFTNASVYLPGHARVLQSLERLLEQLELLCEETTASEHCFGLTEQHVVYATRPLLGASLAAGRLIQTLHAEGIAGLRIARRAKSEDFQTLLELLLDRRHSGFAAIDSELRTRCPRAGLEVLRASSESEELPAGHFVQHLPVSLYQNVVQSLENMTVAISTGGAIDFGNVESQAEGMLAQLQSGEAGILQLSKQQQYDAFTFAHSVRVTTLALNFARHLTDQDDKLVRIGTAALLHDVGKTRVPFELLQSRKPLTPEERKEIMRHPEYGAEILIDHRDCDPCALAACFGHHLTPDGRGYPKSEHEHFCGLVTRMIAITDVYEALTAQRPYKKAMSPIRAFRIMMDQKGHFDAELLRRFIAINGIYPTGSFVELSDGRRARVERQGRSLQEPVTRLCSGPGGEPLPLSEQLDVALDLESAPELHIDRLLEDG